MAGVNDLLPVINGPDSASKFASTIVKEVDIINDLDRRSLSSTLPISETPKSGSTGKLGQNSEESQLSEQDLTTIVDIVRCSGWMDNRSGTLMSELIDWLQRMKEQSNIDKHGTLEGDRTPSVCRSSMGTVVNTPLSQIGNLRWGDMVEEGIETNQFEGVNDSLPLTRIRGISQGTSLEGSVPVNNIVMTSLEGMDLPQICRLL